MQFCRSNILIIVAATVATIVGATVAPVHGVRAEKISVAQTSGDAAKEAPSTRQLLQQELQLTGEQFWVDTGIDVHPGELIVVHASGTLRYESAKSDNGPDGVPRGFKDLLRILPFNEAGRGALIGRIGDAATAQSFLVGAQCNVIAPAAGRFFLGINQGKDDLGSGTYYAQIAIYAADGHSAFVVPQNVKSISGIDQRLFSKLPRRVSDKAGDPGDMVNFLIVGSEEMMQRIFTAAGWVKVDADVRGALLHGLIESIEKESYLTMPMSQLYLFGRPQDYGWAHAEPISVVASRNHLRTWKAPFLIEGETLWVGAATHDTGFDRDVRNNGVTHKIDPDIDLERDYVEKTLMSTGMVTEVSHFLPENPIKQAHTATGESFHSDGEVLVIKLIHPGQ